MSRRTYDIAFKQEAARLVIEEGRTIRSVEESLGITRGVLKDWVSLYRSHAKGAFVGSGKLRPQDAEVHQLRKQVDRLQRDNEILKKAVAIFSKEPGINTGL